MILDTNQSGVKLASVKGQRVILPRLLDAIWRTLEMLSKTGAGLEFMLLDFPDAFWEVPLHADEQRRESEAA